MAVKYILFGNMCSGKTTAAQIMKNELNYSVVSAKNIVSENLKYADDSVKDLRKKGYLLPDNTIVEWVFKEIEKLIKMNTSIVLDGFPRTDVQATEIIKNFGNKIKVIHLDFEIDVIRQRFHNRLICDNCDMPYSRLFRDFEYVCHYCNSKKFSPRPTDKPDYFDVKTSQFISTSIKVIPVLESFELEFLKIRDHSVFEGLRNEVVKMATMGEGNGN